MKKNKYKEAAEILINKKNQVASSEENWKKFLKQSSNFYKYSFDDKLLILHYRPNATICASFDFWKNENKTPVKYGTESIPLIKDGKIYANIFDESDTTATEKIKQWEINAENHAQIAKILSKRFDSKHTDIENILINTTERLFEVNSEKFLNELIALKSSGYFLSDLNESELFNKAKTLILSSAKYTVASRTNSPINESEFDFSSLELFSRLGLITFIGSAADTLSNKILKAIGKEVKALETESTEVKNDIFNFYKGRNEDEINLIYKNENGDYVSLYFSFEAIKSAYEKYSDKDEFFKYLTENADTEEIVIKDENVEFYNHMTKLINSESRLLFFGFSEDSANKLIELAKSKLPDDDNSTLEKIEYKSGDIIGNTPFRYIPKKTYRKVSAEVIDKISSDFDKAAIKYSGRVNNDDTITFTFDGNRADEAVKIIEMSKNEITKNEIQKSEKSFAQQVDDVLNGKMPFYNALKVCDTPQILLDVGCEKLPVLYTQRHLKNAIKPIDEIKHYHGLNIEQIKKLPDLISDPIMIFDSTSKSDSIVVVTSEFSNDNPIIVSIKPNGKGKYEVEEIDANFITSVYPKNNFLNFFNKAIETDNILFCDKIKSQVLFERWGLQLSELTNNLDYDVIIHQSRNIVKPQNNLKNNSQELQTEKTTTFSAQEIETARKTNLVDFLSINGEELKRVGTNEYTLKAHDSMRISENKFFWNSRNTGGNAVDFMQVYYGLDFQSAVKNLLSYNGVNLPNRTEPESTDKKSEEKKPYNPLPYELDEKTDKVYPYLVNIRMIDEDIVKELTENSSIAQDIRGNAVFKIFDENRNLSGAEISGTSGAKYKRITEKNANAFIVNAKNNPQKAIFFESAIDLLSYYSLHKNEDSILISMAGLKDIIVLNAIKKYSLKPENCFISVDNDKAGKNFAQKMKNNYGISSYFLTEDESYIKCQNKENIKDWNDLLKKVKTEAAEKTEKNIKKTQAEETDEKKSSSKVSELNIGDVILYEDKKREVKEINEKEITLKNLDSPDYGGIMAGTSDVLAYDGWQEDMEQKGFEILQKSKTENIVPQHSSQIELMSDDSYTDNISPNKKTQAEKTDKRKANVETSSQLGTKLEITEQISIIEKPKNFVITDNNFGVGGAKENFNRNVEAIRTLENIEGENRTATSEEQKILAQYVGWGGLSDAFDSSKSAWSKEYQELKNLLTEEEYISARSSVLDAHYTSPTVINAIYKVLNNLGFKNGKILEPSMGIGNFFGLLPESMKNSNLYGVELDSITGRIAQKLYPAANIQIKGFEKTNFPENSFDIAVGNVPFGDYKINDPEFKESFLIHDYFFVKALDKVRPGGIVAFVTSKGTLDKKNDSLRKYLAERAELLGAVRLPETTFSKTNVVSDILFLQKRENIRDFTKEEVPEWVNVSEIDDSLYTDKSRENGSKIYINDYFKNHPEMIAGSLAVVSVQYGFDLTCKPFDDIPFDKTLDNAVKNIKGEIPEIQSNEILKIEYSEKFDPQNYKKFSYIEIDNNIYFNDVFSLEKQNLNTTTKERTRGLIKLREILRELIDAQKNFCSDYELKQLQNKLNQAYDNFTLKYGLISSKENKKAFYKDDSYQLMAALEDIDEKGNLKSKADIFTKRTIVPYQPVKSVDTPAEALAVSIAEKACVDIDFMSKLCSKSDSEIIKELEGIIFKNPVSGKYENFDEYLSGNVRKKLIIAKEASVNDESYNINVKALENVQPKELTAAEITAQLGAIWIPIKYYEQFMYELLNTPYQCRSNSFYNNSDPFAVGGNNQTIKISFYDSVYGISNKNNLSADKNNIKAINTYGTKRKNAYEIIEDSLNLRPTKVFDYITDEKGNKKAILNQKETMLAQEKQDKIKSKFAQWIFDDFKRTEELLKIYNEKFNSVVPREYNGSHIIFGGINPEIKLRKHQTDAIAHTLYGGNTLLAHSVGAGKTYEIVASAMESKRLGLCQKSLIVVPKHIVNQTAKEFLQLYPTANILVPTEKDFSKENRKKFCSRIALGNYDAVIISHNQLEKIPLSDERKIKFLRNEIDEIINLSGGDKFTVRQIESKVKKLKTKLEKLINEKKRDRTITFEELGTDRLYIDEAHLFKNLFFVSKMGRNVSGINAGSESQRASDLLMKCKYIDEITNSKGVVFATGTPISNSMAELYVMQRYLQADELKRRELDSFDAWASCFGEAKQSLELAPEGKGYQMKTRFASFFNLPELMNMFRQTADIKTQEVLNLPVPKANYHNIAAPASEFQKEMVNGLAERAEKIRQNMVQPNIDNMLKVTNEGRKLALDQRLANPMLPDYPESKVNICIENVYNIWNDTSAERSSQMIFCDLSTPHYDGNFNVYDDIKNKLIQKGVPKNEIAFVHDCKTDLEKLKLFTKVRNGEVRILLGSTNKMGTGTNCQNKLKALHNLDCPYRPADLQQRIGRIVRQGNENKEVDIYNYVTKGTFDAFLYVRPAKSLN